MLLVLILSAVLFVSYEVLKFKALYEKENKRVRMLSAICGKRRDNKYDLLALYIKQQIRRVVKTIVTKIIDILLFTLCILIFINFYKAIFIYLMTMAALAVVVVPISFIYDDIQIYRRRKARIKRFKERGNFRYSRLEYLH